MQQAGWRRPDTRRGFTLVELLLVVGLLVLLLGAVVFNFSNLQHGAVLEEGTTQLEALIRFARAHASGVGRLVEIRFEEEFDDAVTTVSGTVHVVWEPDPLNRPGVWEELPEAISYTRTLAERIRIDQVHPWPTEISPVGHPNAPAVPDRTAGFNGDTLEAAIRPERGEAASSSAGGPSFSPIRFYPDGSADSVEIILGALDEDETRRVALEFMGMTGTFHRRFLSADPATVGAEEGREAPDEPVQHRAE